MKPTFAFLFTALMVVSCNLFDDSESSTDIAGNPNIPQNTIGNEFSGYVSFGGSSFQTSGVVTENNSGIISVDVTATVPNDFPLKDLLPEEFNDGSGNMTGTMKFKNTSEGILDYTNADGKPLILVKYDCEVGDKYVLSKSDGTKITRTVTAKSETDDYPYGFMYIKTIEVEQDSRIPGVQRIVYYANHKFGLVGVEVFMDDGTSLKSTVYSTYDVAE